MKQKTKENLKSIRSYMINNYLISVLLILVIEVLARHSLTDGIRFVWNHPFLTLLSAAVLTAFYALALLVPKRNFVWLCITVVIVGLAVTNSILLCFRITPLAATDIALLTSVFEIMGIYLTVWQIILLVLLVLVVIAGLIYLGVRMKKQAYHPLLAICNAVISILAVVLMIHIGDARGWLQTEFANLPDAYADNGFVYCFTRSLFDRGISKPDTYDEDTVDNILEDMKKQKTNEVEEKPNIIFIQLESFMDLKRMQGVTYSEEPTPVYSSLRKTCPGGFLKVPSVGAGTANTEFEVLTGMNLKFFGIGEYPYESVLTSRTVESVCYDLKPLGYTAHALHNHTGTFYDRNEVYKNLGFDTFTPSEYMNGLEYNMLGWEKSSIFTNEIIKNLNSTPGRDFIFTVTSQCHGKYPDSFSGGEITVTGSEGIKSIKPQLEYYINQLYEEDKWLADLTAALQKYHEPIMLIIYGDHMPALNFTEEMLRDKSIYQTEYVIWTNYSSKVNNRELSSYNLMSAALSETGINSGYFTKLHQYALKHDTDCTAELKNFQYDVINGEKYLYGGDKSYYKPTELKLGIDEIKITSVKQRRGNVLIKGENFTPSSVVCIDGDQLKTEFFDENTLSVRKSDYKKDYSEIKIAQRAANFAILGYSEAYYREK